MGVHVTFVRSVLLDTWSYEQLRIMKAGGNANATEFFKQYGGTDKFKDATSKYTSKAAVMYKERLKKLAEEDESKFPGQLVLEDVVIECAPEAQPKDDFFGDWELNESQRKAPIVAIQTTTLSKLVFGKPSAPKSTNSVPAPGATNINPPSTQLSGISITSFEPPKAVEQPLQSISTYAAAQPPTYSGSSGGSTFLKTNKKSLGAKKATKAINFEEAERKAKDEEERRAKEDEDRINKELEERTRRFSATNNNQQSSRQGTVRRDSNGQPPQSEDMMDRLGMGFGMMNGGGFGYDPSSEKPVRKPPSGSGFGNFGASGDNALEDSGEATKRFATAKAISSDQYFSRGAFDEQASVEARDRLKNFQGKTGFGSSEYYGRDESGPAARRNGDLLEGVSETARDFAQKFVGQAADDLNSLKRIVGTGGAKLGEMLQDIQTRYQ